MIQQNTGSGNLTVERHVLAQEFGTLTPSPAAYDIHGSMIGSGDCGVEGHVPMMEGWR